MPDSDPGTAPEPAPSIDVPTTDSTAGEPRGTRREKFRNSKRAAGKRRRRRRIGIAAAVVVVLFAAVTARVFVWPDLAALPAHADAIVELAGPGDAGRDQRALDLARQHRAPFLVQSTTVGDVHCLPPPPDVTVLCFHADPNTTRGEAEWIGRAAQQRHWTSVILVTTPDQAWRARLRTSRCFGGKVYVATAHLPALQWFRQIPYQWVASAKALTLERSC